MAKMYARGARAWGICGRSGRKMLLKDMVFDGRYPNMRVDPSWYEARHPQETLPRVEDPIALYRPSPEVIAAPTAPVLSGEGPGGGGGGSGFTAPWSQVVTGFELDDENWQLLGYGNGIYLIIANNPGGPEDLFAIHSTDLVHWTRNPAGNGVAIGSVAPYGGTAGLFAYAATAVGPLAPPYIFTSPDAVTWTQRAWGFGNNEAPLIGAYAGGFLAVAQLGQHYATSPDGITWTMHSAYTPNQWTSNPFWDGTQWIVGIKNGAGNPALAYSPDGINFTETASLPFLTFTPYTIGYDGTTYVVSDNNDDIGIYATSLAGPWTSVSLDLGGGAADAGMASAVGGWEVLSSNGVASSSIDGKVWTSDTLPSLPGVLFSVIFGNNTFVGACSIANGLFERPLGSPATGISLTWTPAETDITEIASYDIYRGVDGAPPVLLQHCPVIRDFLGGIIGVENCTLAVLPEHPGDPYTNVIEDCDISYVDTDLSGGPQLIETEGGQDIETEGGVDIETEGSAPGSHTYCYYIIANPMGNNQSVAQGPPSAPSNTLCVTV